MSFTAVDVQELRKVTGAGMMECKQALVKADGNMEAAIKVLRETGQAKALKKASRVAAEGIIAIKASENSKSAFMVEINTETDFAARDATFGAFVAMVVNRGLEAQTIDLSALLDLEAVPGKGSRIIQENETLTAKIGENIKIRRMALVSSEGVVGTYCHNGRIGVLVELSSSNIELAKDIAMHIAASKPIVVSPENIPAALIDSEKEIFYAQAAQSGKPKEIVEKMVVGRIQKFVNEVSLVGQPFVKDPAVTVGDLLKKANARVISFARFEVGEGIEKEEKDFAKEVMAQVKS